MSSISQLMQLQKIDSELMRLEELKGDLPMQVAELTKKKEELIMAITKTEERLKKNEVDTQWVKVTILETKEKIKKYQEQLYLVRTNREYDALMSEIDQLKTSLNANELKELELSEEKDRLEEQLKNAKREFEETTTSLEIQSNSLNEAIQATETEYNTLTNQRNEVVVLINSVLLSNYDRVRSARDGIAVVSVANGSCGGCHTRLTSHRIMEVREGNTEITCSVCRRFLYWPEEENNYES